MCSRALRRFVTLAQHGRSEERLRCFCLENKQNGDGFIRGRGTVKIRAGPFLDPSDELTAKVNPAGSTGQSCQLHLHHL